ncbi:hypothetical protein [Leclercia adecarboxylata]|uniref:hypothetical protein n=1 Tax=Leclercia adecarboxylata TaxID=83655 RepID=UPI0021F16C63|nr:hypothetical protein [Leclercia adecarboxylata]UYM55294.1 hypothetical protein N5937_21635 [Leclercia adecarboxylata]
MSAYSIYNIISGGAIAALLMTWVFFWIYLKQERRHRDELRKMQREVVMEIKSVHKLN